MTISTGPIRNVRKRLHIDLQIFWGEDTQTPLICHPSPNFFLQKRLHIKKLLGMPLFANTLDAYSAH